MQVPQNSTAFFVQPNQLCLERIVIPRSDLLKTLLLDVTRSAINDIIRKDFMLLGVAQSPVELWIKTIKYIR
jgi:hypothetical protein